MKKNNVYKKALVLGSSKGIGRSILDELKSLKINCESPSSLELDTSNLNNIEEYFNKKKSYDILILNTGGPPAKKFSDIKISEWEKYHKQLFLGFVLILQKININKNGFIFLISSHTIKSPEEKLVLSNTYRVALASLLKTLSKSFSSKNISTLTLALGPFKTKRLLRLVGDIKKFEKTLPLKSAGNVNEISNFIKMIIVNNIKYLNGTTVTFDGGLSKSLF